MRRKNDVESKEYRSYLVVTCKDKDKGKSSDNVNNDVVKISMSPLLVHNVPIIVRPKKIINAKVEINNISLDKSKDKTTLDTQANTVKRVDSLPGSETNECRWTKVAALVVLILQQPSYQ